MLRGEPRRWAKKNFMVSNFSFQYLENRVKIRLNLHTPHVMSACCLKQRPRFSISVGSVLATDVFTSTAFNSAVYMELWKWNSSGLPLFQKSKNYWVIFLEWKYPPYPPVLWKSLISTSDGVDIGQYFVHVDFFFFLGTNTVWAPEKRRAKCCLLSSLTKLCQCMDVIQPAARRAHRHWTINNYAVNNSPSLHCQHTYSPQKVF